FQRIIDLAEIDGRGRCTQPPEHRSPQRTDRYSDLKALQIVRRIDWMRAASNLAVAVVPHLFERKQPGLLNRATHLRAERTVHRGQYVVVFFESETDAMDRCARHDVRQDHPREVEDLDHAGAQLRQHVGGPAELVIGKNLYFHPAAGVVADTFRCLLKMYVHRVGRHQLVAVAPSKFSGIATSGQDAERSRAGSDAGGSYKHPPRYLAHGSLSLSPSPNPTVAREEVPPTHLQRGARVLRFGLIRRVAMASAAPTRHRFRTIQSCPEDRPSPSVLGCRKPAARGEESPCQP